MLEVLETTNWWTIAWLAVGLVITYELFDTFYAWKRLSAVPAPSWIAHVSYLWLAKTTYSGRQYWVHRDLHKKYGPLVLVAPNKVVTNDIKVIKKISGVDERWARGPDYQVGRFNPYHDNLFSRIDPVEHKWAKSRTIAAYSGRETPDLEIGVNEVLKTMIDKIGTKYANSPGESPTAPLLDLGNITCHFTIDAIGRLAFGEPFGYLRDEKDQFGFLQSLRDLWPRMSTCADFPVLRKILFSSAFLKLMGPKPTDKSGFGALMGAANHYVGKRFAEKDGSSKQDMLGSMMRHGLSQIECETEGLLMIIAGTESTAAALRSALIHIITCPAVYNALKQEIATTIQGGKISYPISVSEAKNLPYLRAVVYESIRMRPPLLGLFPKVVPPEGANILGYFIPGGSAVCPNFSALLNSPELFGPDAEVFRPERFTELDDSRRRQMERDVEQAFGNGQWVCVGKTIAFMEIYKSVFEIFRAFDMQLTRPFAPSDIMSYGVFLEDNLMVKVSKSSISTNTIQT